MVYPAINFPGRVPETGLVAHRIYGISAAWDVKNDAQQLLATAFTEASTNLRRVGGG